MSIKKITIGARGSKLSNVQTNIVRNLLQPLLPDTFIEIVTIKTSGDKNLSPIPLDTIGKGWFTKEIDRQLLKGQIDIAVHSLKDLLDTLSPGLVIAAVPKREDAAEALVSREGLVLSKLKKGAVVGTDSIRRKIQLQRLRKDLVIKSVRGNVNRRLEKLDAGEYDALCLAVAGLKRLGLEKRITEYFDPTDFIPSPGQGALAVVIRKDNKVLNKILTRLNHPPSVAAVTAEREFSAYTQGGCSMPVGAYAEIKGAKLRLYGMLGSEDGRYILRASLRGSKSNPKALAEALAAKLLYKASPWFHKGKIILTREVQDNKKLAEKFKQLGFSSFSFPVIKTVNNLAPAQFKNYLNNSFSYDWLIFTSRNGVKFFMKNLETAGLTHKFLKNIRIAAVGTKTAEAVKLYKLPVALIPEEFTALALVRALKNIKGKKILLARSSLGQKNIKKLLEQKGANVVDMSIYRTELVKKSNKRFENLFANNLVLCLTFTSPSTIDGFLKNLPESWYKKILALPVLSIGPVTSKAAKKYGFAKIYSADPHTIEGMLSKLREINL